ncbi:hypothetical protein ACO2I3_12020 [Leptospira interrogans]
MNAHDAGLSDQGSPAPNDTLRPAKLVMAPERAAAAYPNALSFSRSTLRKMLRERWRIELARIELDPEGRGEAIYRITAGNVVFTFFAISKVFPPGAKVDRSFGINWDVSAAICQGDWTPEREAILREEIPKQYDGRYDADVLCFCRGNRSERIFDEVVDALGAGTQPDTAMLASVGYILRSTAFAGNGLFGMTPFEGLGSDHPLGAPYHAQILAAFMLREFVFDLVDSIALARGSQAVKLDRKLKRYLGVGNSAGLGLIPFLANHPRIVDRWVRTHEEALAGARARPISPLDPLATRYLGLVDKAATYFSEDPRDGNGIFASFEQLGAEFKLIGTRIREQFERQPKPVLWSSVIDPACAGLHLEAAEIASGLLLELYPDLVERGEAAMAANETIDFDPDMTVAELRDITEQDFAWLNDCNPGASEEAKYFWYYPVEAPYEPRRGVRGRGLGYEYETPMDLPRNLAALSRTLANSPGDMTVAELTARHPNHRATICRVQSTAGFDYADLHQNYIADGFTPFAACRFLLSFYGMEKFDPRLPRSTKGALLQGAPLADEIENGIDGEWPFPLVPQFSARSSAFALTPLRSLESPEVSAKAIQQLASEAEEPIVQRDATHIFPLELRKLFTKALLSQGCTFGVAEDITRLMQTAMTLGSDSLEQVLDCFDHWSPAAVPQFVSPLRIDAACGPAFTCLPSAMDLARTAAQAGGAAVCRIDKAQSSPLLGAAILGAARRGFLSVIADCNTGETWASGMGQSGPWLMKSPNPWQPPASDTPLAQHLARLLGAIRVADGASVVVACEKATSSMDPERISCARSWNAAEIERAITVMNTAGLPITPATFKRLFTLAKRALVPEHIEKQIIPAT